MDVHQTLGHIVHKEPPQRSELASIAMNEIASGLKKLAALGYPYKIVPGDTTQGQEFPKALYRPGAEALIVDSAEEEAKAKESGWDIHPGLKAAAAEADDQAKAAEGKIQTDHQRVAGDQGTTGAEKKVEPTGGAKVVKAAGTGGAAITPGNT